MYDIYVKYCYRFCNLNNYTYYEHYDLINQSMLYNSKPLSNIGNLCMNTRYYY